MVDLDDEKHTHTSKHTTPHVGDPNEGSGDEFGTGNLFDQPNTEYLQAQSSDESSTDEEYEELPSTKEQEHSGHRPSLDEETHQDLGHLLDESLGRRDANVQEFQTTNPSDKPNAQYLQSLNDSQADDQHKDLQPSLDTEKHYDLGHLLHRDTTRTAIDEEDDDDDDDDEFEAGDFSDQPNFKYLKAQRRQSLDDDEAFVVDDRLDVEKHFDMGHLLDESGRRSIGDFEEFGTSKLTDKPNLNYLRCSTEDLEVFVAQVQDRDETKRTSLDVEKHQDLGHLLDESGRRDDFVEEFGTSKMSDKPNAQYLRDQDSEDELNFDRLADSSPQKDDRLDDERHYSLGEIIMGMDAEDEDEFQGASIEDKPNSKFLQNSDDGLDLQDPEPQTLENNLDDEEHYGLGEITLHSEDAIEFKGASMKDKPNRNYLKAQESDDDELDLLPSKPPSSSENVNNLDRDKHYSLGELMRNDIQDVSEFQGASMVDTPNKVYLRTLDSDDEFADDEFADDIIASDRFNLDTDRHEDIGDFFRSIDEITQDDFEAPGHSEMPNKEFLRAQDSQEDLVFKDLPKRAILDDEEHDPASLDSAAKDANGDDTDGFEAASFQDKPVDIYLRAQDSQDDMYFQYYETDLQVNDHKSDEQFPQKQKDSQVEEEEEEEEADTQKISCSSEDEG